MAGTRSWTPRLQGAFWTAGAAAICCICLVVQTALAAPTPILAPEPATSSPYAAPSIAPESMPTPAPPQSPSAVNGTCKGKAYGCEGILSSRACSFQPGCRVLGALSGAGDGAARRCGASNKSIPINCTDTIGFDFCMQVSGCEWHFDGVQYGPGFAAKPPMAPRLSIQSTTTKIIWATVGCALTAISTIALIWYFCNARWFKKDQKMEVNQRAIQMSKEGAFVSDWDLK